MSRPLLSICVRCEGGEELAREVRALRKQRGLKPVFKIDEVRCLDCCDAPCAVELRGKKRSTSVRVCLTVDDASRVVDAAAAYAALQPAQELPERMMPGESGD